MDRYAIASMFGQGTFGRLYKAHLREDLPDHELPLWVRTLCNEAAAAATAVAPTAPPSPDGTGLSVNPGAAASAARLAALRETVVVIKEVPFEGLPPCEQQDILNEVRVMEKVKHSAFIQYYEAFLDNGCLYIVMECGEGGDLAQLLQRQKPTPLSEAELWRYLVQLLDGLSHLHALRILHRDLKPANIFLDRSLDIKIGDLGLGRILGSRSVAARTTLGTPLYFSPELCLDQAYDEKSDVWSLGVVLYEMATFQPPFLASNQIALAKKIVHDPHTALPSHLSGELRFLINKMLEKDPAKRPSVDQMLQFNSIKLWRQIHQLEKALATARTESDKSHRALTECQTRHARDLQEEKQKTRHAEAQCQQAQLQYEQVASLLVSSESANDSLTHHLHTRTAECESQKQLLEQYQLQLQRYEQDSRRFEQTISQQEETIRRQQAQLQLAQADLVNLRAMQAALPAGQTQPVVRTVIPSPSEAHLQRPVGPEPVVNSATDSASNQRLASATHEPSTHTPSVTIPKLTVTATPITPRPPLANLPLPNNSLLGVSPGVPRAGVSASKPVARTPQLGPPMRATPTTSTPQPTPRVKVTTAASTTKSSVVTSRSTTPKKAMPTGSHATRATTTATHSPVPKIEWARHQPPPQPQPQTHPPAQAHASDAPASRSDSAHNTPPSRRVAPRLLPESPSTLGALSRPASNAVTPNDSRLASATSSNATTPLHSSSLYLLHDHPVRFASEEEIGTPRHYVNTAADWTARLADAAGELDAHASLAPSGSDEFAPLPRTVSPELIGKHAPFPAMPALAATSGTSQPESIRWPFSRQDLDWLLQEVAQHDDQIIAHAS